MPDIIFNTQRALLNLPGELAACHCTVVYNYFGGNVYRGWGRATTEMLGWQSQFITFLSYITANKFLLKPVPSRQSKSLWKKFIDIRDNSGSYIC
jgi:hypothetical protein